MDPIWIIEYGALNQVIGAYKGSSYWKYSGNNQVVTAEGGKLNKSAQTIETVQQLSLFN